MGTNSAEILRDTGEMPAVEITAYQVQAELASPFGPDGQQHYFLKGASGAAADFHQWKSGDIFWEKAEYGRWYPFKVKRMWIASCSLNLDQSCFAWHFSAAECQAEADALAQGFAKKEFPADPTQDRSMMGERKPPSELP